MCQLTPVSPTDGTPKAKLSLTNSVAVWVCEEWVGWGGGGYKLTDKFLCSENGDNHNEIRINNDLNHYLSITYMYLSINNLVH